MLGAGGRLGSNATKPYPCPCCGHFVFDEPPGSYDICPICFWEDDLAQLRLPRTTGANHVSLIEGQANFAAFGVCEQRFDANVRPPRSDEVRDPQWRPLDPRRDDIEMSVPGREYGDSYPPDRTDLYYWRRT